MPLLPTETRQGNENAQAHATNSPRAFRDEGDGAKGAVQDCLGWGKDPGFPGGPNCNHKCPIGGTFHYTQKRRLCDRSWGELREDALSLA